MENQKKSNNEIYRVRLESIEDAKGNYDNEIFIFSFQVTDMYKQRRYPFQSWMSKNGHPQSKVSRACRALMGTDFDIFNNDRSVLIGKECLVEVDHSCGNKIIDFFKIN